MEIPTNKLQTQEVRKALVRSWIFRMLSDLEALPVADAKLTQTGFYTTTIEVNFGRGGLNELE